MAHASCMYGVIGLVNLSMTLIVQCLYTYACNRCALHTIIMEFHRPRDHYMYMYMYMYCTRTSKYFILAGLQHCTCNVNYVQCNCILNTIKVKLRTCTCTCRSKSYNTCTVYISLDNFTCTMYKVKLSRDSLVFH